VCVQASVCYDSGPQRQSRGREDRRVLGFIRLKKTPRTDGCVGVSEGEKAHKTYNILLQ